MPPSNSVQPTGTPTPIISNLQRWYVPAIGELVGTAMFLYLAVGGADAVSRGASEGTAILGVAFSFGVGLMVTAWGFGRISGAHFNPAITLANLIVLLGAMLGVAMARGVTPTSEALGQINHLLMTTEERNRSAPMAPFPIGFTLFSCHLFACRYTNASINPARAFATAVVSREFTHNHWIYWLGPLGGGVMAAALYIFFCYFDFDIVTAANKAKLRAEAAAPPGSSISVEVVPAATSTGYAVHVADNTATYRGDAKDMPLP
ncbi:hypothetical protein BGZ82_000932 [Podila clonocystis]|nr:hypothetical protein BGZ82_000932 [Podila clonocystis]